LQIGCDAAHELECLHHGCKPGIVHRDIKCTNNMNGTFQAKLADFGLSKVLPTEGQPAITRYENENIQIIRWVNLMLADGNVKIIVDPRLIGDFDINSAWKLVELAMACVDQIPSKRPTMYQVATELNDCFVMERARQETEPKKLFLMSLNLDSTYGPNPR
nr:leucine-rich repeat transmembrane protein kinase protein [Tanacetum cinerariifolium]